MPYDEVSFEGEQMAWMSNKQMLCSKSYILWQNIEWAQNIDESRKPICFLHTKVIDKDQCGGLHSIFDHWASYSSEFNQFRASILGIYLIPRGSGIVEW